MESTTTPFGDLPQGMAVTSQQQPSDSDPLVLPQLNPPDLASLSDTFAHTLWQGVVFYEAKPLTCTITSRVTSKDKLCADKWPKSPGLHLFHQPESQEFSRLIQADPHSMLIQFSKDSEASLCSVLRPELVGAVVFSSTRIEVCRDMYIFWLPGSCIFLGSFLDHSIQYLNEQMGLLRPVVDSSNNQTNAISQQQPQQQVPPTSRHLEKVRLLRQFLQQVLATVYQCRGDHNANTELCGKTQTPIETISRETDSDREFFIAAMHLSQLKEIPRRHIMRRQRESPYSKYLQKLRAGSLQNISSMSETYCRRGKYTRIPIVAPSQELNCPMRRSSVGWSRSRGIFNKDLDEPKSSGASANNEAIEKLMAKLEDCCVNSLDE